MNLKQTGQFIKEQRKLKGLTQAELAEKIFVSEKTISKWECGNGFPDNSIILLLCKELDINANELLSGKKLAGKEYQDEAEKNLLLLQAEHEKTSKFLLTIEWILGYLASITMFVLVFVASFVSMPDWARILLIIFGFLNLIFGVHFCLCIETNVGYYECEHCHHKYVPSLKEVYFAMHCGRTRYLKCPKCHKRSWQKKTLKK